MTTALIQTQRRRIKAERLRARNVDPFPHFNLPHRSLIADIVARQHPGRGVSDDGEAPEYHLAGRLIARRKSGSAASLELRDRSGTVRLRVRPKAHALADILEWDIGDIVAVTGRARGHGDQLVIDVCAGQLLTKALQLHHGFSQPGHRSYRPELSLMTSTGHRVRVRTRAEIIFAIRHWLNQHQFIEVETPVLQSLIGGALARPFLTHHNALSREVSLRISSELYLRRCTVGDLERVYELGKYFRNEGASPRHSPEFTMLEWSMAYSDYTDSAALAEQLIVEIAKQIMGGTRIAYNGSTIDLDRTWHRTTLRKAIEEATGLDILAATLEDLYTAMPDASAACASWSDAVHMIYSRQVEPRLIQPTMVFDFPIDTHPCTKRHPAHRQLGESFDIVIGGLEICSGGTEVNDPDEQWMRFSEQNGKTGEHLPPPHDCEYVTALSYGAPPSSGAGLGVDRLLAILLDTRSIGDTTVFPPCG